MATALIVVDMQEDFEASHCKRTIREVRKLIKEFKEKSLPIIIVEYDIECHGETHKCIVDDVRGYNHARYVEKWYDGGAAEIVGTVGDDYFDSCVVCGVNFDCCVYETARGLADDYGKVVTIAESACNTPFKTHDMWVRFRELFIEPWANIIPDEKLKTRIRAAH